MKLESVSGDWLGLVKGLVDRIRFDQVVIAIHQGKVVQVEHTEKTRLEHLALEGETIGARASREAGRP
jgi:hypothetical protein